MTTLSRSTPRRRLRFGRPPPLVVLAVIVVLAALGGGYEWFRGSSLVAVRHVTVAGVSGPDAGQIRRALTVGAEGMTTLDVNMGALHSAVAPYPDVRSLKVSTSFPHTMRITVIEQDAVAIVVAAGRRTAVAGDGTLLHDIPAGSLPQITLAVAPGGTRLTGVATQEAQLAAAAPAQLLARTATISTTAVHGLVATLRNGPQLYFGSDAQLAAKWRAVLLALANPSSAGASYIDVTVPSRPAAGAGADGGSTAPGAGTASHTSTAGQTTPQTTAGQTTPQTTAGQTSPQTTAGQTTPQTTGDQGSPTTATTADQGTGTTPQTTATTAAPGAGTTAQSTEQGTTTSTGQATGTTPGTTDATSTATTPIGG